MKYLMVIALTIILSANVLAQLNIGINNLDTPQINIPTHTESEEILFNGSANSSWFWGIYPWIDYDMPTIKSFAYNQTTPAISYATSTFVKKTGDTMTGTLNMSNAEINLSSGKCVNIGFSRICDGSLISNPSLNEWDLNGGFLQNTGGLYTTATVFASTFSEPDGQGYLFFDPTNTVLEAVGNMSLVVFDILTMPYVTRFLDNYPADFGTGLDAQIYYNGSDLIINPKAVGTGQVKVLGTIQAQDVNVSKNIQVSDGTIYGGTGTPSDLYFISYVGNRTQTIQIQNNSGVQIQVVDSSSVTSGQSGITSTVQAGGLFTTKPAWTGSPTWRGVYGSARSGGNISKGKTGAVFGLDFDVGQLGGTVIDLNGRMDYIGVKTGWNNIIGGSTNNGNLTYTGFAPAYRSVLPSAIRPENKRSFFTDLDIELANETRIIFDYPITIQNQIPNLDTKGDSYIVYNNSRQRLEIWDDGVQTATFNNGNTNATGNLNVVGNVTYKNPYGSFSDTSTQTVGATATAYLMKFNTTESSYLIQKTADNTNFSFSNSGNYLVELSIMGVSSVANTHLEIWIRKNGVNVPRSNTRYEFKGVNSEAVIEVPFILNVSSSDKFQVMYAGDNTGVSLPTTAATAYSPITPSAIMTITRIGDMT